MQKSRGVLFCCVENLTFFSILFYVLPYLIFSKTKRLFSEFQLFFIDSSRAGLIFNPFLQRIAGTQFQKLDFFLVDIRDERNDLIRLRIAYKDLLLIQDEIMKNGILREFLESQPLENNRLKTILRKQTIAFSLYDPSTVWRMLLLVHVVKWKSARENNQDGNTQKILFTSYRTWMRELIKYAEENEVKIFPVRRMKIIPKKILSSLIGENRLRSLYYLYINYGLWRMIKFVLNKSKMSNIQVKQTSACVSSSPKLMVEYYGHLNLDRPELYSDLFFWQRSELSSRDILITFNIPQDPLHEESLREIVKHEMSAVALHPKATMTASVPVFHHLTNMADDKGKFPILVNGKYERSIKKWIKHQVLNYREQVNYWVNFFTQYNIRLYINWFKYDVRHCFIADALQNLGGITTIYQRAFEELPSPETTVACDIIFGFSPAGVELERKSHSVIAYYVVTGYYGDHRFVLLSSYGQAIREHLQKHGANKIIAYFDENSADDSRWHTGHEFMRENYSFLLEKVLSEPWLGLVLKPKTPQTLRKRLGLVEKLLRQAEETGRCVIVEGGNLHGSYPPASVVPACDIAIHGHLCAATAGFEAALMGKPALLLDREGWSLSSLYQLGNGQVVFTNWQDLWKTCLEYWKTTQGIPGFGDWSVIIKRYDPFRDGRAAERMGMYLKWLLDGIKAKLPREVVMAEAAERYAKIWGKDKVICFS